MNLIEDPWIPVIRKSGRKDLIAPCQIVETDDPVIELNTLRPDFQGALYQFLIGLLQTTAAPENMREWKELYDAPPLVSGLATAFERVRDAFYLWGNSEFSESRDGAPAFMQDYGKMPAMEKSRNSIASLLIEMPGTNTLKSNKDHFIKRGEVKKLCPACSATALFTLQINAPAGGSGHRVGLRGGGPLTTLLCPGNINTLLWNKLWLNVLTEEGLAPSLKKTDSKVFPWMGPTRRSDRNGVSTLPGDMHPLHPYWGMPRRIWLIPKKGRVRRCDICGMQNSSMVEQYAAVNYGFDYADAWIHPLTPYNFDSKKKKPPLSIKGQKGGLSYKHWVGIALNRVQEGDSCAGIVNHYFHKVQETGVDYHANIWCFGYDMDNMKARCWYEHEFLLFALDLSFLDRFSPMVEALLALSREGLKILKSQIKFACFSRPGDVKGDLSIIDAIFLDSTESFFYELVTSLSKVDFTGKDTLPEEVAALQKWMDFLRKTMVNQFDSMVLDREVDGIDMKRVIRARQGLLRLIHCAGIFKKVDTILKE